jgi:hypothetical protein
MPDTEQNQPQTQPKLLMEVQWYTGSDLDIGHWNVTLSSALIENA